MPDVPRELRERIESLPHVVGTAVGRRRVGGRETDETCLIVFVDEKLPEARLDEEDVVPATVELDDETIGTDVQEVGDVRALSTVASTERRSERGRRWRPAPGGVSGGHPEVSAGTLGSPALETAAGETVVLTNAHVGAPIGAEAGDDFLQPGPEDGGTDGDAIGELLEWSEVRSSEPNATDSALIAVDPDDVREDVLGVGPLTGFDKARVSEAREYVKSGRTTGVTTGGLRGRDARIRVGGFGDELAVFEGVDVFGPMGAGGDSGSLIGYVEDGALYATSLLFAGSDRSTLGVPMAAVEAEHGTLAPVATEFSTERRVRTRLAKRYGSSALSDEEGYLRVDAWPVDLAVAVADGDVEAAVDRLRGVEDAVAVVVDPDADRYESRDGVRIVPP